MCAGEITNGSVRSSFITFAAVDLPLYYKAIVTIKVGKTNYQVSGSLRCDKSAYFAAMFKEGFKEGHEQAAELKEIEGVVSENSFEMLLQWIYQGHIIFDGTGPEERISATIEVARLADMLGIGGMEDHMVHHIKAAVKAWNEEHPSSGINSTGIITCENIRATCQLPGGHSLRRLLVQATIGEYIKMKDKFRFRDEIRQNLEFGADLLDELSITLGTARISGSKRTRTIVTDPFNGRDVYLCC